MELEYPSQKENRLDLELNKIDRRFGSFIFNSPVTEDDSQELPSYLKKLII